MSVPLAFAAAAVMAGAAHAAATLDQSNVPGTGLMPFDWAGTSLSSGYVLGQTFTVGVTGQLTRVDLAILGSSAVVDAGGFTVSIEKQPGVSLGSGHVDLSTVSHSLFTDWSAIPQIDLSGFDIQVVASESYRIILTVDPGTDAGFTGWLTNGPAPFTYDGGAALAFTPQGEFVQPSLDYGFRTYVATPEPGTWALLTLGFGVSGALLRRRRAVIAG